MAAQPAYKAISITLPTPTIEAADRLLTPTGFMKPAKGTYSELFSRLLAAWVQEQFGADMLDVLDAIRQHPNASIDEIKNYLAASNAGLQQVLDLGEGL
jgi:hypothetical protein